MNKSSFLQFFICLFLAVAVLLIYAKTVENGFVHYDDYNYVVNNEPIQNGFTADGLLWTFGTHASNWHPLTWMSHMLDYRLFGLDAGGHHLGSVLIHLANTVLWFLVLRRMTGTLWRSAFVAVLFGVHPLHVESVAWVAERKDVLSGLFWILTTWAYVRYAERPGRWNYFWVVLFFVLSLLAKPLGVTLPFTLLLLDLWPLQRWPGRHSRFPAKSATGLVVEKLPLFALTALSCFITLSAQGIATSLLDFDTRLNNGLVSYAAYLVKMLWPVNLAVFYPHPLDDLPWGQVAGAAVFLLGVTIGAVRLWRRFPYLAVGWFWYLGTLVPMIGLIQVGAQAQADRYTYIPLIGIFIVLSWGMADLARHWRLPQPALAVLAGAVVFSLLTAASRQVGYWRDSGTLFRHAVNSVPQNYLAHMILGNFLMNNGNLEEAANHLAEAVRIKPDYTEAYYSLAEALSGLGKVDEAVANYSLVVKADPQYWKAYVNMGTVLFEDGRFEEAAASYLKALALGQGLVEAQNNLGQVYLMKGNYEKAVHHFSVAVALKPGLADAHNNLGYSLAALGRQRKAVQHFRKAIALKPRLARAHFNLANILAEQGKLQDAVAHLSRVVEADAAMTEAHHNLGVALVRLNRPADAAQSFATALRLEPDFEPSRRAVADLCLRGFFPTGGDSSC